MNNIDFQMTQGQLVIKLMKVDLVVEKLFKSCFAILSIPVIFTKFRKWSAAKHIRVFFNNLG
jgi:hypothetical protein